MTGFFIGVAASFVAAILWYFFLRRWLNFRIFLQIRNLRRIWSPFLKGSTTVIITGRTGPLPRSSVRASFSEVQALLNLIKFFNICKASFSVANSVTTPPDTLVGQNIILLGGKSSNEFTRRLSSSIAIKFEYDENGNLAGHFGKFPSEPDNGNPIKKDYAIVLKCNNPFSGNNKVLLIAGNHGAATDGATKYLVSSKGVREIAKKIGDDDFLAIIRIEVNNNVPHNYSLVRCWHFREISG